MNIPRLAHVLFLSVLLPAPAVLRAWDYEGHRMVNQAALAALPEEFPRFVREPAASERIAFLAGEPDRWRNTSDLPLKHYNGLDHYFDLEYIHDAGLELAALSSLRYEFAVQFATGRAAHPAGFPAIDADKNRDRTREWCGFAPWAITEYYGKLKSAFSYLRTFEQEGGTAREKANARENVIYLMGVMGHYVGDCAQPLHTTVHYNGWVGANPQGFSTAAGIHSWIDGGFIARARIALKDFKSRIAPATAITVTPRPDGRDPMFVAVLDYVVAQHRQVEPLYRLEKTGAFNREGAPASDTGKAFIENQLLQGGEMLARIWVTAWREASIDTYLQTQLMKRQGRPLPPAPKKP